MTKMVKTRSGKCYMLCSILVCGYLCLPFLIKPSFSLYYSPHFLFSLVSTEGTKPWFKIKAKVWIIILIIWVKVFITVGIGLRVESGIRINAL